MRQTHSYIFFPENLDDSINSKEKGLEIIKDFQMTIDLADCEIGSKLYYSKTNKDKFFANIQALEEFITIGSYDFETVVNTLFSEGEISAVNEDVIANCQVKTYQSRGGYLNDEIPLIFYDIIRKHEYMVEPNKQIILNLFNAFFSQNPIFFIKHCGDLITQISVEYITTFKELDTWQQSIRIKRNFNDADTRHIEGSNGYIRGKSPLLGGIGGRDNVEKLLKSALCDKRRNNNKNDLVNFDEDRNEYIWYEYEGDNPENQFHAYHLVLPTSHQRDSNAVNRISDRVFSIINYRKKIN